MAITNSTDRFNGVIASLAVKVRAVVGIESNVAVLSGISNPYSGINIVDLDRVLLVAQTDPIENGAWDVSDNDVWTRAFDWDGNRDVEKGSTIWAGQAGGLDKLWQVATDGVIIPGSTAVSIVELLDPLTLPAAQPNPIILTEIAGAGPDVPGEGQIWVRDDGPNVLIFTGDDGVDHVLSMDTGDMQSPWLTNIDGDGFDLNDAGVIFMREQAAANADVANQGQFWVRNTLDGEPMFTDDQGVDSVLNTGGGGGGTPAGADEQIQYNESGAFGASAFLEWDRSQGSLIIDARDGGNNHGALEVERIQQGATGLKIQSINGNTTFHNIWVSFDSGGESSWKLVDDHTGALRTIFWEDDFGAMFLEFEVDGADDLLRIGGHTGSEKVFMSFGDEIFSIRNGTTLYFEEVASANPDLTAEGQVWVRSDTPNTLMFTDDAGTDIVVAGSPTGVYTRNAAIVEDRTLLASASATTLNNNNVLAALIADLTTRGVIG